MTIAKVYLLMKPANSKCSMQFKEKTMGNCIKKCMKDVEICKSITTTMFAILMINILIKMFISLMNRTLNA